MDLIQYQFAEPKEILNLNERQFQLLLQQKIYIINKKFQTNQQCLYRLIQFIKKMQVTIINLKIIKDLIRHYQTKILFFLKDFYDNSDCMFKSTLVKEDSDTQTIIKKKAKIYNNLQQISSLYKMLTDGLGRIQYFDFLTKYGTLQKKITFTKEDTDFQKDYMKFLKKCFQQQYKMKDPNIPFKTKHRILQQLDIQFNRIIGNRQFVYFQELTFKTIQQNCLSLIQQSKHPGNNLQINNINPPNNYNSSKKKRTSIDADDLQAIKNISPCCRTFFYENEPIKLPQNFTLEYKNYQYPYNPYCIFKLRRTICGFLNRAGGVILVGIYQRQTDKYKQVKGQYLSQNQKQNVLKDYKQICKQIYPDIISQTRYSVKFVPIKSADHQYLPGKYIIRIQITAGDAKFLYSYKDGKQQFIAFRTANEVLRNQINQQTLQKYKQRLLNPIKYQPIHDKPCPQPQIGEVIWKDKLDNNKGSRNKRSTTQVEQNKQYEKKGYNKKWIQKQQNRKKQKKCQQPLDYVYYNSNKSSIDKNNQYKSNNKFICDEDDDDQLARKKIQQVVLQKQQSQQSQEKQQNKNDQLDFQPLNPVAPRIKQVKQVKKYSPPIYIARQKKLGGLQQNGSAYQSYKVQKNLTNYQSGVPMNKANKYIDLLIAGYPYKQVKVQLQSYKINIDDQPINCNNDLVTWIKVINNDKQNIQRYKLFQSAIIKKQGSMNNGINNFKIRKIHPNIFFQDQILLSKLIHKFNHNEQFIDRVGCYYFSCGNNVAAIQAFIIGWQRNIKAKFISDLDLKTSKLQQLKFRIQNRSS